MQLPEQPLVSVIIPSFNQGKFIRETIDSCLAQDWRPLEIIVVDGGSNDETVDVLRDCDAPELIWSSERDNGVVDAVNKGLAIARGELITIQSSDDAFLPGGLRAAVEALRGQPGAGLVYGDVELIDAASHTIGEDVQGPFELERYLGRLQYIPQPGTVFTRDALESVRGWRDAVSYAADADFWLRIAVRMPVVKLDRKVGRYRYHDAQRDTQRAAIARDWRRVIEDLFLSGALSTRERRFARMGLHLSDYRYLGYRGWAWRTRALYAAALANPAAIADPRFPRRELIPAREPIWAWLSRVKRRLGFRPRTG